MNYARHSAWCCHASAALAAVPVEHCVDDMIGSGRMQTVPSGWTPWRLFADLCGWRVPAAESPPPGQVLTVLGAEYDLRPFPHWQLIIRIAEWRWQVLSTTLHEMLESGRLSSGQAARMWETLQHASFVLWRKYGAATLRDIIGSQRETQTTATSLSIEMVATCVAHERDAT